MLNAYQMAIRCSYWFIHVHVCCLVTSNKIVAVRSLHSICACSAHAVQASHCNYMYYVHVHMQCTVHTVHLHVQYIVHVHSTCTLPFGRLVRRLFSLTSQLMLSFPPSPPVLCRGTRSSIRVGLHLIFLPHRR